MIAALPFALASAQAVEQIAPAAPPHGSAAAEQVAPATRDPTITQLPAEARVVPQPVPRASARGVDQADVDRAAAVILSPTTNDAPARVGSELGPDTIRQLARDAVAPTTKPAPGAKP